MPGVLGRQDTGRQYVPRKPVTVGWEPDLPAIRRGTVLDPFCGTATAGEVALNLGRHFIGIELYENHAQIAEDRCRQAHLLRIEYEAGNLVKASTPFFDEALNDPMPDEVDYSLNFDPPVSICDNACSTVPSGTSSSFTAAPLSYSRGKAQCPSEVASSNTWSMPARARLSESRGIPTFCAIWSAVAKPIP